MDAPTPHSTQGSDENQAGLVPAREGCIATSPTSPSQLEEATCALAEIRRRSPLPLEEVERLIAVRDEIMRSLLAAEDAEDTRVARMLHDNVGQYVAALQLTLRGLEKELERGGNIQLTLQSLQTITQSVGQELHKVALELRPTSLDDHGLVHSLASLFEDWSVQNKIAVEFDHLSLGEERLPSNFETTFFRIIREALQLAKQARASQVSVILQRRCNCVIAVIEDDGNAAPVLYDPLAQIKGRVCLLNGEVSVEDAAESGKTIVIRLPLSRNQ